MRLEDLVIRADQLIAKAEQVAATKRISNDQEFVEEEPFRGLRAASLSFLVSTFGKTHAYHTEFESQVTQSLLSHARRARGILSAAREELAEGWLETTKGLVSAAIFADFLEMAQHLLDERYKDAAAVIAGSVLEEHLRQLCDKNSVRVEIEIDDGMVPRKADTLNADLRKAGLYNLLDQKNVTTWLDLRNNAAHGRYDEYTIAQVTLMLEGIRNFMVRIPV